MSTFPSSVVHPLRGGDLTAGTMVGHWQIEHELGRGGMGTVYAVVHTVIGKRAAMKVIHHQALTSDYTAERFLTEARAVNAVPHPNIVDIFESGTLPDGRPYLVMERLRGKTLGVRHDEGRMPALEVIDYLVPLCDALAAAHAAGIVHHDIKLDNVFLVEASLTQLGTSGGPTVKLLDWGIASMVNLDGEPSHDGILIGTPRYVAPEQARGEPATAASDVYSLGVVAYELFLEEPPFNGPSAAELLAQHLSDPPPMPREVWPQIPPALEDLLLAMLAKTPALRPTVTRVAETLVDLRHQLRRAVSRQTPVPAIGDEPTLDSVPLVRHARSGRRWRWSAAIAMVAVVLGVRVFVARSSSGAVATSLAGELASPTATLALAPVPPPAMAPPAPVVSAPAMQVATPAVRHPARRDRPALATRGEAARSGPAASKRRWLHPDAVIDPY